MRVPNFIMALAALIVAAPAYAGPTYPQVTNEIPRAFWGGWDEIIEDGCEEREPYFHFEARYASNFEVTYDVLKVTVLAPYKIKLDLRSQPDFGEPANEVWELRLIDDQTMSAPDGKPPYIKRCPEPREKAPK